MCSRANLCAESGIAGSTNYFTSSSTKSSPSTHTSTSGRNMGLKVLIWRCVNDAMCRNAPPLLLVNTFRYVHFILDGRVSLSTSSSLFFRIPAHQILANDTTRFQVQSQSDKNRIYEVDIAAFSCSCAYYPTLRYCKHIAAVQLTFPSLTSPIEEATTASGNSRQSLAQLSTPEPSDLPAMNTTMPPEASCPTSGDSHSSATWDRIKIKFHSILSAASTTSSTFLALPATNDVIIKLEGCLDQLSTLASHNATPGTLPPTQRVPPHILCKTETQNTLPRAKDSKNARKRNTDPFSAGERPGKLAKMDAKGPAAAEAVKAREKLPLTSLLQSGSEPSVDRLVLAIIS